MGTGLIGGLWPAFPERDYSVRLATGLMAVAFFFAGGAVVAGLSFYQPQGYVGSVGNVSYFRSLGEIVGSKGQSLACVILAAGTFVFAVVVAARGFMTGFEDVLKLLGMAVSTAFAFGLAGYLGHSVIQLFVLGSLHLRLLFWGVLPLLYAAGIYAALRYAKDGHGTWLQI